MKPLNTRFTQEHSKAEQVAMKAAQSNMFGHSLESVMDMISKTGSPAMSPPGGYQGQHAAGGAGGRKIPQPGVDGAWTCARCHNVNC